MASEPASSSSHETPEVMQTRLATMLSYPFGCAQLSEAYAQVLRRPAPSPHSALDHLPPACLRSAYPSMDTGASVRPRGMPWTRVSRWARRPASASRRSAGDGSGSSSRVCCKARATTIARSGCASSTTAPSRRPPDPIRALPRLVGATWRSGRRRSRTGRQENRSCSPPK